MSARKPTQIELDQLKHLRNPKRTATAMRDRLNARHYLLQQGWTVKQIDKARDAQEEPS